MAEFGEMIIMIVSTYTNFLMSNFLGGLFLFFIVLNFAAIFIHFGGRK